MKEYLLNNQLFGDFSFWEVIQVRNHPSTPTCFRIFLDFLAFFILIPCKISRILKSMKYNITFDCCLL